MVYKTCERDQAMMTPFPITQDTPGSLTLFKLLQHIGGLKGAIHGTMQSAMGTVEEPQEFTTILKKLITAMGKTVQTTVAPGNIAGGEMQDKDVLMSALNGDEGSDALSRQCAILAVMLGGDFSVSDGANTEVHNGMPTLMAQNTVKDGPGTRHRAPISLMELMMRTQGFHDTGSKVKPGMISRKSQLHVTGVDKSTQTLKAGRGGEHPIENTQTVKAGPAEVSSDKAVRGQGMLRVLTAAGNDFSSPDSHGDVTQSKVISGTPDMPRGVERNRQVPVAADSKDMTMGVRDGGVRNVAGTPISPVRGKNDRPRVSPRYADTDISEMRVKGDVRNETHREAPKTDAAPHTMSVRSDDRSLAKGEVCAQSTGAAGDEHELSFFKGEEATSHKFADLARITHTGTRMEGTGQTIHAQASSAINGSNDATAATSIRSEVLFDQVVQGARQQVLQGGGRMKITLNPPQLGTLNVDVVVRKNKVHVMLRAANADVKHLLQANTDQLKVSLGTQGLVADTISVSVHDKTGDHAHGYGYNDTLPDEHRNNREQQNNGREHTDQTHETVSTASQHAHMESGAVSVFA